MDVIMTNYDAITYYKGISVVRMLKQMVGDTAFNNGIRSYLDDYEFSSANADDLWEEFTRATGGSIQVKELMDSWILQQGYPVVDVIKSTSASGSRGIQLDQSLFLIKPDDVSFDYLTSSYSYKWYLEFTSITENDDTVRTNYLEMDNRKFY
ncbi:aminopeptidase N-like [Saccoglossus kowalevskii]|uniref:Leucyl-cystinyl aminopeptidase-like n=1 Tax=Saccoglossus kowalevskii TaxID=10224 RepID=A0ABM0MMC4_SACKO|nr:PREDICTED: leucyl-cystinyl aminopeptidase-like [Saccoglossus kowalevskii]